MTVEPQTLDDACEAVRACARAGRTIGLTGGEHPAGPASVAVDDVISLRHMNRVVEYAPPDQIVTAEAGMTIAQLQSVLGEREQRLAVDPPEPERTTVGGFVASNAYGPLRTRYGTAKDVIVGMTIVRADGTRARGGGKVVKNVAGFDIPKLMIGTYGTLALIATVTFRLHPIPRVRRAVVADGVDPARIRALTAAMVAAQLEPSAAEASYDGTRYRYRVTFEGFAAGVRAQCDRFSQIEPSSALAPESSGFEPATRGELAVRLTAPASQVEALHRAAIEPLYRALGDARACLLPFAGVAFASGDVDDEGKILDALNRARAWCESAGGTLVVNAAPPAVRAAFDAWGTPPPAFELMRALKERFDPQRLLQPGGFVGGL